MCAHTRVAQLQRIKRWLILHDTPIDLDARPTEYGWQVSLLLVCLQNAVCHAPWSRLPVRGSNHFVVQNHCYEIIL